MKKEDANAGFCSTGFGGNFLYKRNIVKEKISLFLQRHSIGGFSVLDGGDF